MLVKTAHGELMIEVSGDPDYPGVYIDFRPDGSTYSYTVLSVEDIPNSSATPESPSGSVCIRLWTEPDAMEDYTTKISIPLNKYPKIACF